MSLESDQFPYGIFLPHHDVMRPVAWQEQFANHAPIRLEIGFGMGEFLIQQSLMHTDENFIGLELDWSRVYKCLQKISGLRRQPESSLAGNNVRIMKIEAVIALQRLFVPRSLDGIICLFPCPWPKKSHVKYRLFTRDFFVLMNSRLKDGAQVRIVTDWQPYYEWMLTEIQEGQTGFQVQTGQVPAQFGTKFERKWRESGQEQFWELRLNKTEHKDVSVLEDEEMKVYFLKAFDPINFRFENMIGDVSVILKDFVFDWKENKGLVRMVVAEKFLTQHVWAAIVKSEDFWFVAKAEGHSALPTSGVALALERVYQAACQTAPQPG